MSEVGSPIRVRNSSSCRPRAVPSVDIFIAKESSFFHYLAIHAIPYTSHSDVTDDLRYRFGESSSAIPTQRVPTNANHNDVSRKPYSQDIRPSRYSHPSCTSLASLRSVGHSTKFSFDSPEIILSFALSFSPFPRVRPSRPNSQQPHNSPGCVSGRTDANS